MPRFFQFNSVLWLLACAVILWLLGGPLVMNEWAKRRWQEVPCRVRTVGGYEYVVNGDKYLASRRDFWQTKFVNEKARQQAPIDPDDHCWVNPADPKDAVLRLDAWTHWENSEGRLASVAVVVAVVIAMALAGKGKNRPSTEHAKTRVS